MNKRFIFSFSLLLVLLVFTIATTTYRPKGFTLQKILSKHPYNSRWDFGQPTEEQEALLDQVASQTFRYLGSGAECYAFLSEDGQIVIKLFKQKHMKTQIPFAGCPMPYEYKLMRDELISRRSAKRMKCFGSYQIAYERIKKYTGVLFLHLNHTTNINRSIRLITPKGKPYILDMDKLEFLIQKRADSVYIHIMELMDSGKVEEAKDAITSILDLLVNRSLSGVGDSDTDCEKNIGFINGEPVHIDVGEFYSMKPCFPSYQTFSAMTKDLRLWLNSHYPELIPHLDHAIEVRLESNLSVY